MNRMVDLIKKLMDSGLVITYQDYYCCNLNTPEEVIQYLDDPIQWQANNHGVSRTEMVNRLDNLESRQCIAKTKKNTRCSNYHNLMDLDIPSDEWLCSQHSKQ